MTHMSLSQKRPPNRLHQIHHNKIRVCIFEDKLSKLLLII